MAEITVDRVRDIEDRVTFLEDCINLLCQHLGVTINNTVRLQENEPIGFSDKKKKKGE